ncbi:MAG: hypothetical protein WDW38_010973 [Sanguina aurantia]
MYINDFSILVAALVPKLDKLTPHMVSDGRSSRNCSIERRSSSISPPVSTFWTLWDILFCTCDALDDWTSTWPRRLHSSLLHTSAFSISDWLLTASRRNSKAWSFLKFLDPDTGKRKAQIVLIPHIHCLFNIGMRSSSEIAMWFAELPPTFVSTLCSLACEHLSEVTPPEDTAPLDSRNHKLFLHLASALANIHNDGMTTGNARAISSLAVPSVVETLKRALSYCPPETQETDGGLTRGGVLVVLHSMLQRKPPTDPQAQLSDAAGSLCLDPVPSLTLQPQHLTPDRHLLSLIISQLDDTPFLDEFSHMVMRQVVNRWTAAGEDQTRSFTVLLHHCLARSVSFMRDGRERAGGNEATGKEQPLLTDLVQERQQQQHGRQLQLEQQHRWQQDSPAQVRQRPHCAVEAMWGLLMETKIAFQRLVVDVLEGPAGATPPVLDEQDHTSITQEQQQQQLQARRQLLSSGNGLALSLVNIMTESLSQLEFSIRAVKFSAQHSMQAAGIAYLNMVQLVMTSRSLPPSLPTCLTLTATVRKMVTVLLDRSSHTTPTQPPHQQQQQQASAHPSITLSDASASMTAICLLVRWASRRSSGSHPSHTARQTTTTNSAGGGDTPGSSPLSHTQPCPHHHLQTLLLVCLVPLCRWKPSSTGLYPVHLVHRMLVVADASATTMPISGSLYDFEMSPEKGKKDLGDNGRRDRNLMKKEANDIMQTVYGVCTMSERQLAAVQHLLTPQIVLAIPVASKLPRSNQARARQENFIAKLIRTSLTEFKQDLLLEAVREAKKSEGIFTDHAVQGRLDEWTAGLLDGDKAVAHQVYSYPLAWAPPHQQLRQLVRQCQQALSAEAVVAIAALPSRASSLEAVRSGSSGEGGSEEEEAAAAEAEHRLGVEAELEQLRVQGLRRPVPKSRALLRALAQMLKPLASRVCREREEREMANMEEVHSN